MTKYMNGAGWYEFLKNGDSYTILIFPDGFTHHTPHPDVDVEDFKAAVDRGEAWRLVRTEATYEDKPLLRVVDEKESEPKSWPTHTSSGVEINEELKQHILKIGPSHTDHPDHEHED
jgi:hypothetical protein